MKRLWIETWFITILTILVFIGLYSCGKGSVAPNSIPTLPDACGTGLAAMDLTGTCRKNPPSMGALEVL